MMSAIGYEEASNNDKNSDSDSGRRRRRLQGALVFRYIHSSFTAVINHNISKKSLELPSLYGDSTRYTHTPLCVHW